MNKLFAPFLPPWAETGLQPAFYDLESGTVLQQTARMYDKVNQLIRLFNELSEETQATVNEYINKFVELKDYVDTYFENLDVQEEINNKLDKMAEDGTLADIIAAYIQLRGVLAYNSVAEMKAATNLTDGSFAETYGYYSYGDGGSAKYKIRQVTNQDTEDDKFIIALADENLVAELITDDMVNICQVGGQQNFSTAFNYLITNSKKVYVPAGSYTATDTITITGNTIVVCDGDITLDATDKPLFVIQDRSKKKLSFNGNITCTGNVAFEIGNGEYAYNTDLYVKNISDSTIGILINPDNNKGVAWSKFEFRHITATEAGIDLSAGDNNRPFINANTFIGGDITSPIGIRSRKGTNQTDRYNDNSFERIGFTGSIECYLDLQFMERSWFTKLRISESFVGTYYIKLDDCRSLEISNEASIPVNKVLMTNNNVLYPHKFIANDIADSNGNFAGKEAITTLAGNFIIKDGEGINSESSYLQSYHKVDEDVTTWDHIPDYYINGMSVVVGHDYGNRTMTLTLPDAISKRNIREFIIYCRYKNSSTTITLVDVDGNSVSLPSGSNLAKKTYLCKFIGKSENGFWKLVELTS